MDEISVTGFLLKGYLIKYIRHMLVLIITGISCTAIRNFNYYHSPSPTFAWLKVA